VDLDSAAEELYGVAADEFAEHRTRLAAQAKAAGDKVLAAGIGKLRKPVLAAALVNQLVRREPAELDALTGLGERMREAHRQLRGAELRVLSEQRHDLLQRLTDLVRETAAQAGHSATEPVLAQVRGTFDAAIADEAAEAAVLSGRLTTVLSYTGFGEVDVTDAVATPVRKRHLRAVPDDTSATEARKAPASKAPASKAASRPAKAPAVKAVSNPPAGAPDASGGASTATGSSAERAAERRRQRHQEQLRRAEAEHSEAVRELEQAQHEAAAADEQHQQSTARVEQLRAQLDEAQEQAWRTGQASKSAERARLAAEQEAERTAAAVQAARALLDGGES
jgi:hypothetical protein